MTVKAYYTDNADISDEVSFTITVEAAVVPAIAVDPIDDEIITLGSAVENVLPVVTTTNAPEGSTVTIDVTGLPDGVTYDVATGTISGTPTVAGQYTITVNASYVDNPAIFDQESFSLTVSEEVVPTIALADIVD